MEALLGQPIRELVEVDPQRFAEMVARLSQGSAEHDYEFILPREGEALRVLSLSMTPLRDPADRTFSLTVVVARDVTGRRELERQVVEWQERARRYLYAIHPPEIAEAMVEGRLEARNLHVSVLFTDITNFTGFATRVSASEVARALHRYFTAMSEVVLDHHGWVDKFVGDSIMALFGVPGGAPDHERQAVHAAAAMAARMCGLELPWRHKIGIATGQVVVGDIGSRQKPTYTAIGDPVNLASRLTAMARPGEVLLCSRMHAAVAGEGLAFEDLGELDVRGYGVSQVFRLLPAQQRV
jgi:class 3 adenylate cyclase